MTLNIHSIAAREIDEIVSYYEGQRAGLGLAFYAELYEVLRAIERNPRRCGWLDDRHRRCSLARFKYGVVYRVAGNAVTVIAVMHLAREPGYWHGR